MSDPWLWFFVIALGVAAGVIALPVVRAVLLLMLALPLFALALTITLIGALFGGRRG